MASSRAAFSRLSSRLQPLAVRLTKNSKNPFSPALSSIQSTSPSQVSVSSRRLSRLPVQLSCAASMMPMHSAIASARLVSSLSDVSQSWALVPQGISMPL